MSLQPITKAIIPVAGLGTRFYPATKAQPKEMLNVWDTPAIQRIVQEVVDAGITDVIFVTSPTKDAIHDHFAKNEELEELLDRRGKTKALAQVQHIAELAHFHYRSQDVPLGDGHAILQAQDLLQPGEPVLVCFGDDLVANPQGANAAAQLIEEYKATGESVILLERVPLEKAPQYGMVAVDEAAHITAFVEKPAPEKAPSDLGVVGKFVLTADVFSFLHKQACSTESFHEIRLADAFTDMLVQGKHLRGKVLSGKRFDTGSKLGWLKATLWYAAQDHPDEVRNLLVEIIEEAMVE